MGMLAPPGELGDVVSGLPPEGDEGAAPFPEGARSVVGSEKVVITSKQHIDVDLMRNYTDPESVLRAVENKVREDFEAECRQRGIAVGDVEFFWTCVMTADGVAGGDDYVVP